MRIILFLAWALLCGSAAAAIDATDDAGKVVTLQAPAKRIISMAPHITELLHAAGAGERIVGTVEYSDFPEAAKRIPRIGNYNSLDLERIVALKPDLIVVWLHGNPQAQIDRLLALGIPVFHNEPTRLTDIARSIETLGKLAGSAPQATAAAVAFRARVEELRTRYADRAPVSLFYQVWSKPLTTLNGTHLVGDVIALCGGRSLFADLKPKAPVVAMEAVIEADPEAIISTGLSKDGLDLWAKWTRMRAVKNGHLFVLDGNLINRHGPRIADGAGRLCEILDQVRRKR
jgi:iron complex transport system substrate-binding protein